MPDQDAQRAYLEQVEAASLMIPEVLMADLEKSYVWRINHVPGDPMSSAYQEGQKSMVIFLRQLQATARARQSNAVYSLQRSSSGTGED